MKKLASVWILASLCVVAFASTGCSSAPKKESPSPVSSEAIKTSQASPVDLGAASSGRGR